MGYETGSSSESIQKMGTEIICAHLNGFPLLDWQRHILYGNRLHLVKWNDFIPERIAQNNFARVYVAR